MPGSVSEAHSTLADTGLEVLELYGNPEFARRQPRSQGTASPMQGIERLAAAFEEAPETILQELVNAAMELCGADSVGISLRELTTDGHLVYRWIATAGAYAPFLNAVVPGWPSACAVCIDRETPQLLRVSQVFFKRIGVEAPTVTDGIMIPWRFDRAHGTIWIMAHGRTEAFNKEDLDIMQILARFSVSGLRRQQHHRSQLIKAGSTAAASMAHRLAHDINNPLQSLTNVLFLASQDQSLSDTRALAKEMAADLERLASLVESLLKQPPQRL